LKIAVDVDSVLADVIVIWLKLFLKNYNKKIEKKDVNTWNFWKKLKIEKRDFEFLFTETWKEWIEIPPTENNISLGVENLSKIGTVDIVTGRTKNTINYVKSWLKLHSVRYTNFVYVPITVIKSELDYDVFIDDSPAIISRAARDNKYAIVYDQPWNKNLVLYPKILRVQNLLQAEEIISKISKIHNI
jgi:5'(3')-deoxyribonucleotidase